MTNTVIKIVGNMNEHVKSDMSLGLTLEKESQRICQVSSRHSPVVQNTLILFVKTGSFQTDLGHKLRM
jgi:hypothetical protein